jgi:serine/threonine protein kinase
MGVQKFSIRKTARFRKPNLGVIARRYVPREIIGRGGAGEVFLAYDRQLQRLVAVKRVHLRAGDPERRARFAMEEAKRLARLQHPNIVTVYDVLEHKGDVVMVMEYLSGHTLESLDAALGLAEFAEVARQCLDALGAAHSLGMVHLDIKSTNIILTALTTGRLQVKLLDFGLAAMIDQQPAEPPLWGGGLIGSVYTVAPEQLKRQPVDARTDLYSLGCVFYHALSRREPFQGVSVRGVIEAHLRHEFRPLAERRPDLPPDLGAWVERLMALSPADRPESAAAALAELEKILSSPGVPATPPNRLPPTGGLEEIAATDQTKLLSALGSRVTVSGVVDRIWENAAGTIRFLNFESVNRSDFSAVLLLKPGTSEPPGGFPEVPVGTRIRVNGVLSEFHGSPQVVVFSPDQIAIVAGSPPPDRGA